MKLTLNQIVNLLSKEKLLNHNSYGKACLFMGIHVIGKITHLIPKEGDEEDQKVWDKTVTKVLQTVYPDFVDPTEDWQQSFEIDFVNPMLEFQEYWREKYNQIHE